MQDFRRLLQYLKPYTGIFILALTAMFIVGFFETATLALLVPITNQFTNQFLPQAGQQSATLYNLQKLIPPDNWLLAWQRIAILLFAFTALKGVADYFSSYLMAKIGQSVVLNLRSQLYQHILDQSAYFFEKHRTNFLVARLVTNSAAIEAAVSTNLRDVLRESISLVAFLGAAFYYNWRLTLGSLVTAPLIGVLTAVFSKSLRRRAAESVEGNKQLNDAAQETLTNQTIVKAYSAEEREKSRFARVAEYIARANLRAGRIAALSPPIIELIGVLAVIALLYFGLREIHLNRIDAPQFFAFLISLLRSYDPMRKLSRQHNELNRAFASAKDIWDVLDETEKLPEKPNALELEFLADKIELKNVGFHYPNKKKMILRDVSIEIPQGAMIALVGESGGGKSTLIKLLQRLFDPTSGAILWDGVDLRDANLSSLKKQIALVTQETVLFNETLRYNISYGKPDASDEEIRRAAKIAFAADFIEELPEKYDTLVGERGTFLSGGQRQRIAIARAVLTDAPVLILDEATSALDAESEKFVQMALANLMQNRTSVVIAHRLSTVRRADRIFVLEKGNVIETGTHAELIARGGIYNHLYELQFSEEDFSNGKQIDN